MRPNRIVVTTENESGWRSNWSWFRFACGFVPCGVVLFFNFNMPFFDTIWPHVAETILGASICGVITARFGDLAVSWILSVLRWLLFW